MRNPKSKVSDPNSFVTEQGDEFHIIYTPLISENGSIDLRPSGKVDIQAEINSYRDSTDMAFILNRLLNGDDSFMNHADPLYGDFTSMPKTFAEAMQLSIDAERNFNSLPLNLRQQFDNDYSKWMASAGSDEWSRIMSDFFKVNDKVVELGEVKDGDKVES